MSANLGPLFKNSQRTASFKMHSGRKIFPPGVRGGEGAADIIWKSFNDKHN